MTQRPTRPCRLRGDLRRDSSGAQRPEGHDRRRFLRDLGALALAAALGGCEPPPPAPARLATPQPTVGGAPPRPPSPAPEPAMRDDPPLHTLSERPTRMPALFVGHGSPMNALEDNAFSRGWRQVAAALPERPQAIVCVSAHWQTRGVRVTAAPRPRTIHDFGGFPQALYEVDYPAPGAPEHARLTDDLVASAPVAQDLDWGLDHGTWSVLIHMFPDADVPVYQLSLDRGRGLRDHAALAAELAALRERGVLIVGSGNVVHNLRRMQPQLEARHDWAVEFDAAVDGWARGGDLDALTAPERLGAAAELSINSAEHYLPLLYALGARRGDEPVRAFNDQVVHGAISMRSFIVG